MREVTVEVSDQASRKAERRWVVGFLVFVVTIVVVWLGLSVLRSKTVLPGEHWKIIGLAAFFAYGWVALMSIPTGDVKKPGLQGGVLGVLSEDEFRGSPLSSQSGKGHTHALTPERASRRS